MSGYVLDDLGLDLQQHQDLLPSMYTSRPALGPTQSLIQLVFLQAQRDRCVTLATCPCVVLTLRMCGTVPLLPMLLICLHGLFSFA